jgi:RNA polymerase sigma factor (sigma-70 family)
MDGQAAANFFPRRRIIPVMTPRHDRPAERDLLVLALAGDTASLATAFERWRPRLLAAGLRLLNDPAEAQDAVQETFLVALARLHDLREQPAFGGWLLAILRNHCLQQLRMRRHEQRVEEIADDALIDHGIDQRLDRHALREWIFGMIGRLPEPFKLAALLRYFGSYPSYAEIAAILDVPVGTVRSRLAQVKQRLADAVLAQADLPADDDDFVASRLSECTDAFAGIDWHPRQQLISRCNHDVQLVWARAGQAPTRLRGREHLEADLRDDLAHGVRYAVTRALGDRHLSLLEAELRNDPQFPEHCPPGATLLLVHGDRGIARMHIFLSPRPPREDQ